MSEKTTTSISGSRVRELMEKHQDGIKELGGKTGSIIFD